MIRYIRYLNFKALRDATLKLGSFTLLVGPNGSGKSTALGALRYAAIRNGHNYDRIKTVGAEGSPEVRIGWTDPWSECRIEFTRGGGYTFQFGPVHGSDEDRFLKGARFFTFDAPAIARPVALMPRAELESNGQNLAAVVDRLRDENPERFEKLNDDLDDWLPEFDRILLDTPGQGTRELRLRLSGTKVGIQTAEVSDGTLFALVLLTLANLATPPTFVGIEEPDRGVHPRMLRRVQDALYRLSYPEQFEDPRPAVQVVVTTHSPFLLDLFRDRPEQIVIAERKGAFAEFSQLVERSDIAQLLGDASLGDLWYSGILGGVPPD